MKTVTVMYVPSNGPKPIVAIPDEAGILTEFQEVNFYRNMDAVREEFGNFSIVMTDDDIPLSDECSVTLIQKYNILDRSSEMSASVYEDKLLQLGNIVLKEWRRRPFN